MDATMIFSTPYYHLYKTGLLETFCFIKPKELGEYIFKTANNDRLILRMENL